MFVQILALLLLFISFGQTGGKVESVGAFADQAAPESVRNALEPNGYRVVLKDGSALCEIWFRKGAPTRAKADVAGAVYTELADSTLVGVISFSKASQDYRGQTIKPGAYTLRYALHPVDGNHIGIAPTRDFLLLVPVAVDQDVNALPKFEDLSAMSKKASGTTHPAPLSLVSPEDQKTFPAVVENEQGHTIFVVKLKTGSGAELPFALVVKGVAEQ
jgi:hypothetical protein